ncbi:hypothetical protein [Paracoccus sp. R86501]|uniref:hypothetical protein n=1 Tax=Paracoccus sp. R86501 TaxID=3101711 RepID=UPI00366C492C
MGDGRVGLSKKSMPIMGLPSAFSALQKLLNNLTSSWAAARGSPFWNGFPDPRIVQFRAGAAMVGHEKRATRTHADLTGENLSNNGE